MMAPIIDLSLSVLWHFLIVVFESPSISHELMPKKIPNLTACNPASASATNEEATFEWRTDFVAKTSPRMSRTTSPEADLKEFCSKAVSKPLDGINGRPV
ncbi:hypothetical protein ES332_A03G088100v1 [Gossypium tomentosum]|uniref:BURP domain-containing protein n=1 Tax=Gossypium tomentosum TaxID=34277 RepID=A0A5D2R775_GOSTO|nr:hypothetical protein ES332_A03G088100v1 [Gossypium tomentosum]